MRAVLFVFLVVGCPGRKDPESSVDSLMMSSPLAGMLGTTPEPAGRLVSVHNIYLDEEGNLLQAHASRLQACYRVAAETADDLPKTLDVEVDIWDGVVQRAAIPPDDNLPPIEMRQCVQDVLLFSTVHKESWTSSFVRLHFVTE